MFLNEQELYDLTHRHRSDAQVRALRNLGIDHGVRADGTPIVLKSHIEKRYGGIAEKPLKIKTEPNWNAL